MALIAFMAFVKPFRENQLPHLTPFSQKKLLARNLVTKNILNIPGHH